MTMNHDQLRGVIRAIERFSMDGGLVIGFFGFASDEHFVVCYALGADVRSLLRDWLDGECNIEIINNREQ